LCCPCLGSSKTFLSGFFDSPVYVEIFIKMVRRILSSDSTEGRVTLTEMLHAPEQVWLPDADGRTHTSEFRIVAWDLAN
jgi:hypothetical protein